MISVSLNNEKHQLQENILLSDALQLWGYGNSKIAVAINQTFIPRSAYNQQRLTDGDQIDIVKPVGGG